MVPLEGMLGPLAPEHWQEFAVGLVLAVIVAAGVQKLVVPRFEAMYAERSAQIEGGINRAEVAQAEAQQVKKQYQEQLAASRQEAAELREQARAQGTQILAEARAQAQQESERIIERARQQIQVERDQAFDDLRGEVGGLAMTLAERIVGESLRDSALAQRSVDRFLDELEHQPARTAPDYVPDDLTGQGD
nr:F0F1 ATP synthase subunit B [Brooklawnia cerclae]